ncbi:Uncharacterized protein PECH_001046 [Penicillium ucsense]|uniref:ribonuclease H n=1 Tax=Penicillium ucsense TaxID=2839758 RepID=A0A8J8WAE6_9EURO|nr:Uncharacterized protein PECM_002394 [Penicillium ucsense]KAF7738285.1 Uncharacterized protein PECH_001046 [Penicillium ucsense]
MHRSLLKRQKRKTKVANPDPMLEYPPVLQHRDPWHSPDHLDPPSQEEPKIRTRGFSTLPYPSSVFKREDIEVFDGRWVYVACHQSSGKCPHCMNHVFHIGCLVISVSGVLSTEIPPSDKPPRSSIGIFFGRGNNKNLAVKLDGDKHTAQTAELKACLEALTRIFVMHTKWQIEPPTKHEPCYPLHTVVIKSESEYLVKGATEWLAKWKENGWKKSNGQPVANVELWRVIDAVLKQLEYDINVKFWNVPRELNLIASTMTKGVIDEV